MKTAAIVQARMGSTRLPGKVMKKIIGIPMIELLLKRLSKAQTLDSIIVAVSDSLENITLKDHIQSLGFQVESGDEMDVLGRYFQAANKLGICNIVRITGDCPLIDPNLVDMVVRMFQNGEYDYVSNNHPRSYPKGLDTEIFTFKALEVANQLAVRDFDREHVTPFIINNTQFNRGYLINDKDFSKKRWTVDEASDFAVVEKVFEYFDPNINFTWKDVLKLETTKPEFFAFNSHLIE